MNTERFEDKYPRIKEMKNDFSDIKDLILISKNTDIKEYTIQRYTNISAIILAYTTIETVCKDIFINYLLSINTDNAVIEFVKNKIRSKNIYHGEILNILDIFDTQWKNDIKRKWCNYDNINEYRAASKSLKTIRNSLAHTGNYDTSISINTIETYFNNTLPLLIALDEYFEEKLINRGNSIILDTEE